MSGGPRTRKTTPRAAASSPTGQTHRWGTSLAENAGSIRLVAASRWGYNRSTDEGSERESP